MLYDEFSAQKLPRNDSSIVLRRLPQRILEFQYDPSATNVSLITLIHGANLCPSEVAEMPNLGSHKTYEQITSCEGHVNRPRFRRHLQALY